MTKNTPEANWLATLPFLYQRSLHRLAVTPVDMTAAEKQTTERIFRELAEADGVPEAVSRMAQAVSDLLGHASSEVTRQKLVADGVLGDPDGDPDG